MGDEDTNVAEDTTTDGTDTSTTDTTSGDTSTDTSDGTTSDSNTSDDTTTDGDSSTDTDGSDDSTDDSTTDDSDTTDDDSTSDDDTTDNDDNGADDLLDDDMEVDMEDELIEDLKAELSVADTAFNETLMAIKIRNALREVKRARHYPSYYTDEQIESDLYDFYSNVRAIALYDYNMIGIEGQTSSSENNTSRSYVDRNSLFGGVIPLSR